MKCLRRHRFQKKIKYLDPVDEVSDLVDDFNPWSTNPRTRSTIPRPGRRFLGPDRFFSTISTPGRQILGPGKLFSTIPSPDRRFLGTDFFPSTISSSGRGILDDFRNNHQFSFSLYLAWVCHIERLCSYHQVFDFSTTTLCFIHHLMLVLSFYNFLSLRTISHFYLPKHSLLFLFEQVCLLTYSSHYAPSWWAFWTSLSLHLLFSLCTFASVAGFQNTWRGPESYQVITFNLERRARVKLGIR